MFNWFKWEVNQCRGWRCDKYCLVAKLKGTNFLCKIKYDNFRRNGKYFEHTSIQRIKVSITSKLRNLYTQNLETHYFFNFINSNKKLETIK